MKKSSSRIVILVCGLFIVTFAMVIITYNVTMIRHIESKAQKNLTSTMEQLKDIDSLEDWSDSEVPPDVADLILVDSNYKTYSYYTGFYGRYTRLLSFIKKNGIKEDTFTKEKLNNGSIYYVIKTPNNLSEEGGRGSWLAIYNATSEIEMLTVINIYVILIGLICGIIAAFLALRLAFGIRKMQDQQKKFFENASHELKTPLMSIQGYAEGIYQGVLTDQKQAAAVIMSESDKMSYLVEQILSLSRLESGETEMKPEAINVSDIVNDSLVSLETVITNRGLIVETDSASCRIVADTSQFKTVVINLISNAVKYADTKIAIRNDKKSLSVWNDGGNLTSEDMDHIFDRFYIGKKGQTGIGLALVQEIVTRQNWHITVKNKDDGVMFLIVF